MINHKKCVWVNIPGGFKNGCNLASMPSRSCELATDWSREMYQHQTVYDDVVRVRSNIITCTQRN